MRRRDFVRRAAGAALPLAIGPPASAQTQGRPHDAPGTREPLAATLALHYMTSLDEKSWSQAGTWPVVHDPAYPLPRGYNSDDPVILRAHDATAARHGFVWLWSWWGRKTDPGGDWVLQRYLDSTPGSSVQLVILYEARGMLSADRAGLFNFDNGSNFRQFVEDVAYLDRTYWSNPKHAPRFYRVHGRPVLFPWVSRNFTGAWPAAVAAARDQAAFFLVGSEFVLALREDGHTPLVRDDLAQVVAPLDAVSGYGIYDPRFVPASGHFDAAYASRYDRALRGWAELLADIAPHARFIPPLELAFDDRYYRPEARHPPLASEPHEAVAAARIPRSLIDDARTGDARYRSVLPLVFVASWNEHIEGSAIEWTVEHGYDYVLATITAFRG
jgi:hypothetical protein